MRVVALQSLTIGPGTALALSQRQADRRAHLLADEGGGRYRTLAAVSFKAGEEFGVDVELPKALADVIVSADLQKKVARKPKGPATSVDPARLNIE